MKVALTNSNKFAITDFKPKHKLNLMTNGYVRIENDNRDYLHRFVMGNPKGVVHHINGNKLDITEEVGL